MGKPPGDDDETRDQGDPDRAAILARRQRFIALALSGLATTACEKPKDAPDAPKSGDAAHEGKDDEGASPQACLKVAPPEELEGGSTGKPMPCLEVMPPTLDPTDSTDDGAPPQACLKIAAPEPKPKPHPCLSIRPPTPEPKPKPQPCLKVRAPEPDPERPKPQPCLRVAKPGA